MIKINILILIKALPDIIKSINNIKKNVYLNNTSPTSHAPVDEVGSKFGT